jgi:hypothetical protein
VKLFLNGDSALISGSDNIMRKTSIRNKIKTFIQFYYCQKEIKKKHSIEEMRSKHLIYVKVALKILHSFLYTVITIVIII